MKVAPQFNLGILKVKLALHPSPIGRLPSAPMTNTDAASTTLLVKVAYTDYSSLSKIASHLPLFIQSSPLERFSGM